MDNRIFGYARVSSADQNLDRQLDALGKFPVQRDQIYADKASGKDFRRPQYQRLLRRLREGDVLVIKSIDRLGRNYREVLDEWRRITVDRNASIVVLDMPLLDTREQPDGITGTFMADLVLQILSYVAQLERENIKQRQAEGIAVKRSHGGNVGGRPRTAGVKADAAVRLYLGGETPIPDICAATGVSKSTLYRILRERGLVGVRK